MKPSARSAKWLKDRGWMVANVEKRLHIPNAPYPMTRDCFGFGDLLAAHPEKHQTMLVQVTGGQGGNLMARVHKIVANKEDPEVGRNALQWLLAGNYILCLGWAQRGARGKAKRWTVKIKQIYPNWKSQEKTPESIDDWILVWADLDENNFLTV